MAEITRDKIFELLADVKDPEIPVLSLVDLGIISDVRIQDDAVTVELRPTFVGCPALEIMQGDIREALMKGGVPDVFVEVSFKTPWTSDLISERGREALRKFGLAPPPLKSIVSDLDVLEHAECPRCGGVNTETRNTFGPTLCRSIHYCNDCREAFEQFKVL